MFAPSKKNSCGTILIVDDDRDVCRDLKQLLEGKGHVCLDAHDGKEALSQLAEHHVDLLLLDLRLPRVSGMEVLRKTLDLYPNIIVIVISGHGTIAMAVEATKLGAYDFLEKPLELNRTLITVRNALDKSLLKQQRDQLLAAPDHGRIMISQSPVMKQVLDFIKKTARLDSKVLICGESGTGKELVARAIHARSLRSGHPFVPVNCSAIPEGLIESTLFGNVKGAFTGALDRKGKFVQAEGGTLFLDEIADMSPMMQAKVLRVLEDNVIERVGGQNAIPVNVRIITASCKNLKQELSQNRFRHDLYFRLNVLTVTLPPLRERHEDLRPLAEYFLQCVCGNHGLPDKSFSDDVWPLLQSYHWPGNVRELRNVVEQVAVLAQGDEIRAEAVKQAISVVAPEHPESLADSSKNLRIARAQFEREFICKMLARHGWRIKHTADALGIRRNSLWQKMQKYGIDRPKA